MDMVAEDGRELEVHSYLIVFLKFVQVSANLLHVAAMILFSIHSLLCLPSSMTTHNS